MSGKDPEFDYYELAHVLGEGGMGVVYKARDRRTGLPVAIKVMSKRFHDPELQFRFVRENEILASLNHRNIVRCYDVTRARDGTPSLVMEFVDGVDFRSFEGLPFPELLPLMLQTLLGMRYLRAQNIVHRDLSSNNILVCLESESRLVKIVDFGIAKILYNAPTNGDILTQTGQFLGKFSFASPELLLGSPFDWKSDVYSLGVIFYRLLTGQFPVRVERTGNYFEWVMAHQRKHDHDFVVPQGCPPLPRELSEAVRGMLSKDPEERPSSWEEIIATFDGVQRATFARGLAPDPAAVKQLPPKRTESSTSRPGPGTPADSSPKGLPPQVQGSFPPQPVAALPARLTPSHPHPPHSATPRSPVGPPPVPGSTDGILQGDMSGRITRVEREMPEEASGSLTEMVAKPLISAEGAGAVPPSRRDPTPVRREPTPSRREVSPPRRETTPSRREATPSHREPTPPRRELTPARRDPTPGRIPEVSDRVPLGPLRSEPTPRRPVVPEPPTLPAAPAARPGFDADGPHRLSTPIVRPRPHGPIASGRSPLRSHTGSAPVIVQGERPGWAKIVFLVIVILGVFSAILFFLLQLLSSATVSTSGVPHLASPAAAAPAPRSILLEG